MEGRAQLLLVLVSSVWECGGDSAQQPATVQTVAQAQRGEEASQQDTSKRVEWKHSKSNSPSGRPRAWQSTHPVPPPPPLLSHPPRAGRSPPASSPTAAAAVPCPRTPPSPCRVRRASGVPPCFSLPPAPRSRSRTGAGSRSKRRPSPSGSTPSSPSAKLRRCAPSSRTWRTACCSSSSWRSSAATSPSGATTASRACASRWPRTSTRPSTSSAAGASSSPTSARRIS